MIQAARKMSSLSVTSVHEGSSYRVETPINRESHDFTYVRLLIEIGPNMGANLDRC